MALEVAEVVRVWWVRKTLQWEVEMRWDLLYDTTLHDRAELGEGDRVDASHYAGFVGVWVA